MASSFIFSDFLISLIIILCTSTITTQVRTKEKHFQVYSLLKSNFIYPTIKNRNQKTPGRTKETFWEKADICMSIIKSEWMNKVCHLNVIDLHEEGTFLEVRQDYPRIYRKSYTHYTADSKDPIFENPYRLFNITIRNDELRKLTSIGDRKREIISENVFSCLARNRHNWQLAEYFISPEYNFKIPVRFIFEYNEIGEMVPIGIAVQSTPGSENIDKYFEEFKREDDETGVFNIGSDSVSDYLSECKKESQERRSRILKAIPKPSAVLFGHS